MDTPKHTGGVNNNEQQWVKLTTQVSSDKVKRKFKAKCAEEGVDMREVVDALIQEWLRQRD